MIHSNYIHSNKSNETQELNQIQIQQRNLYYQYYHQICNYDEVES